MEFQDELGLLAPEPLGEGGPELHYFLLGNNALALMPWMVKPYNRRQLTREERIANYRISRGRRVVENPFDILVSRFRVLLGTMEPRPRVLRDIVFMFVVLHNMLRTHQGRADMAPTPGNDVVAQHNVQTVYVLAFFACSRVTAGGLKCFVGINVTVNLI